MVDVEAYPSLTFPSVEHGTKESKWDISYLLHKGGAGVNARRVKAMIAAGKLGPPIRERMDLVREIHEAINGKLIAGGSKFSAGNMIRFTRDLFVWAESSAELLTIDGIQQTFLRWCDALIQRHQVRKDLSLRSAYTKGAQVGAVLDAVLNRDVPLISLTRLRMPPQRKAARGGKAEKQSLAETFAFGHFLQDVCDALPLEVVMRGELPVHIRLRDGREMLEWSGYPNPEAVLRHLLDAAGDEQGSMSIASKRSLSHFREWTLDGTLRTRYPLVNRRCEAELLMFIGQTGMNFAQAHRLRLRNFHYASHLDGYQVRERKSRRGGDVLFEVFREYRPHFERYLEWRRAIFPDSDALFPFVRRGGRVFQQYPQFALRRACKELGIRFVPPQELRNTRVNWLLRRSGDSDLTADMAQHTKETLHDIYERPSQQRAMVEVTRFWASHDPTIMSVATPAPGECDGIPAQMASSPENVAKADCMRPSGCLWCEHHRDVDSEDHVWALACFRHLKLLEVAKWIGPKGSMETHPAQPVIDRISDKIRWFHGSSSKRREWAEEAMARVEEGNYHPSWSRRIAAMEGES
ncbi:site-specific integrase [Stenotrophomonas maltophilia]|jgi:integrase|uniref:site-specific integrase n=1 Tax=Stenotrophomonas maltophilia TaxID=40324 RepID=UPI0011D1913C|nr:site-specific integrase [Stenotrophomonas maltophilia]